MIIQSEGSTSLLITQPDHAALAGRIMMRWKHRDFGTHPRRPSILLAVSEHDNGWREVDSAPVLDAATGRMLDFVSVPAETRRAIWPRGVERLSRESNDPWAAALVAQHAVHVYRHYREDREWAGFFSELEATRDTQVRTAAARRKGTQSTPGSADLTIDDLHADYFFVRMGDLLSLTFCNAWTEAPDELGYTIRCQGERLTVWPDPFDGLELAIEVPARTLQAETFGSSDAAASAFEAAPVFSYRGVMSGATTPGG